MDWKSESKKPAWIAAILLGFFFLPVRVVSKMPSPEGIKNMLIAEQE